jgi:toxin ParE1/3/4
MEAVYEFIAADTSERAFAWFNELAEAVYSLEQFPERGTRVPENKNLHQLLFGKKPSIYRIIFATDKRNRVVNVLHMRHGARAVLPGE